jgi:hypothetical protein
MGACQIISDSSVDISMPKSEYVKAREKTNRDAKQGKGE